MTVVLAAAAAALFGLGTYLVLQRKLSRTIIGLALLSHGANVLLLASGSRGVAPLVGLADDADTDRAIAVLEDLPGVTAERTDEGLVADLDGFSRAAALQALVKAGIDVDQFTPRRRLEDAFLALVGES